MHPVLPRSLGQCSFLFLIAWLLAFPAPGLLAQDGQEAAVAAAVDALKTAMVDGDREALEAITLPELSYGHSSGLLEDRSAFVEALASGTSDFRNMELTEQTITVAGNTALVRHTLRADVVDRGRTLDVYLGVLLVWQKRSGAWKLLARQAYKL